MTDQIKDSVGFLFIQVARAHRLAAESGLNQIGLHAGQEILLLHLGNQAGLTQSELAHLMNVEAPTITKMLQRMEAANLVERRPDPDDGRVTRVYLTAQGKALREPVVEVWQNLENQFLRGLSEMEQALLRRLFMQLLENLTEP